MNKKQRDQMQFSPKKKKLEKRKWIHHAYELIPVDGLSYKMG